MLLSESLLSQGFLAKQASGDADETIISTALEASKFGHETVIVGNDTDLLIILLAQANKEDRVYILNPNSKAQKSTTLAICKKILGTLLRLFSPFMP